MKKENHQNPAGEKNPAISRKNLRECPKCGAKQDVNNTECVRCGLIFEKYRPIPRKRIFHNSSSLPKRNESFFSAENIKILLFHINPESGMAGFIGRGVLLIALLFWGLWFITAPIQSNTAGKSFFHLINLPFHEAGHIFFRPFGRLITSMGGSLGQLIVPLICCFVLLFKTRDPFGGAVTFWWFGENFLDLAPYVNDARNLVLPLVGGNTGRYTPYGFHDWQFILTETGLLKYDHLIAQIFQVTGALIILTALIWGFSLLFLQYHALKR